MSLAFREKACFRTDKWTLIGLVAGTRHSGNWSSPSSGEITKHTLLSYNQLFVMRGCRTVARVPIVVRETEFKWQVRVCDESLQSKSCKATPSGELHTELTHSGSLYCKQDASYCCLSYFFTIVFVYIMNPRYFPLVVPTLRRSTPNI